MTEMNTRTSGTANACVDKDGRPYATHLLTNGGPFLAESSPGCREFTSDIYSKDLPGNKVEFFTTGAAYFTNVAEAIKSAQQSIFICGWELDFAVMLNDSERLWDCLSKALANNQELRIYALPWASPKVPVNTNDLETMCAILLLNAGLEGPMRAFCLPALSEADMRTNTIAFSHHQKCVVIDNKIAYMGGMDMAYGRRDDHHFALEVGGRHGRERYNPCIPPAASLKDYENRHYLTTSELFLTVLMEGDKISAFFRKMKELAQKFGDNIDAIEKEFAQWIDDTPEIKKFVDGLEIAKEVFTTAAANVKEEVIQGARDAGYNFLKNNPNLYDNCPRFLVGLISSTLDYGNIVLNPIEAARQLLMRYLMVSSLEDIPPEAIGAVCDLFRALMLRLYTMASYIANDQESRYRYLSGRSKEKNSPYNNRFYALMPPGGKFLSDKQPRMPWQDVHCKIEGPSVYDLSMNFVRRWNGLQARMHIDYKNIHIPDWVDYMMGIVVFKNIGQILKLIARAVHVYVTETESLVAEHIVQRVKNRLSPDRQAQTEEVYKQVKAEGEALDKSIQQSLLEELGLLKKEGSGIMPEEARRRIDGFKAQTDQKMAQYKEKVKSQLDSLVTPEDKAQVTQDAQKALADLKAEYEARKEQAQDLIETIKLIGRRAKQILRVIEAAEKGFKKGGIPGMILYVAIEGIKIFLEEEGEEIKADIKKQLLRVWAGACKTPVPEYIPAALLPVRAAPVGGYTVQVLRSASSRMLKHEQNALEHSPAYEAAPKAFQQEEIARCKRGAGEVKKDGDNDAPTGNAQDNCHEAIINAVQSAINFIYIEGQFFLSEHGNAGRFDENTYSGPAGYMMDYSRLPAFQRWKEEVGLEHAFTASGRVDFNKLDPQRCAMMYLKAPEFVDELKRINTNRQMIELTNITYNEQTHIENKVCEALAARITRAINEKADFHVYIVLPVYPEGDLSTYSLISQIHFTQQSLFFGEKSLVNRIRRAILAKREIDTEKAAGKTLALAAAEARVAQLDLGKLEEYAEHDWRDYLTILNLRNWTVLDGTPVTEQIYVHSKLVIVDDRIAVLGSANINDRSLLGTGDSELAVMVKDSETVKVSLDGKQTTEVSKGIHELRKALWKKIFALNPLGAPDALKFDTAYKALGETDWKALGRAAGRLNFSAAVIKKFAAATNTILDEGAKKSLAVKGKVVPAASLAGMLDQPGAPATWKAIQKIADDNAAAYEKAFHFIPRSASAFQDMNPPRPQAAIDRDPVNGKRGASVWPCWKYQDPYNHAAGGEMAAWHPFELPYWQGYEKYKEKAEKNGEKVEKRLWPKPSEPEEIQGFIVTMPPLWTAGENNYTGINMSILAQMDSNFRLPGAEETMHASNDGSAGGGKTGAA